jgi:creatinine amidohydrolase
MEEAMTDRISDLSWEAFRERAGRSDLVLVPVGTLEAHGGGPLGTDTIIPAALAADLAPRLGALIAPPVAYGVTNSLLPYPGSTTVSPATFVAYLFEACAGLVDAGLKRVVMLNGHGGQTKEVHEVVHRLWDAKRAFAVAIEWWGPAGEQLTRDIYGEIVSGHAGVEEMAMVLAAAPETLDRDRVLAARRLPLRRGIKARPFPATVMLERPESAGEGAPVLDPARARRYYEGVVDAIERALREVLTGWEDLRPPGPTGSR